MQLRMSRPLLVMAVVLVVCVIKSQSAYKPVIETNWRVEVITSLKPWADTDDDVYIKLYGKKGETSIIELDNPGDDFEMGALNGFLITAKDVGAITKIKVWGGQKGDGWHLDKMFVEPSDERYSFPAYLFECNCWFDSDGNDANRRITERFLTPKIVAKRVWKITTYTGDDYNAGTEDEISITIKGSKGSTDFITLNPRYTSVYRLRRNVYFISVLDTGTSNAVTVRASRHGDAWQLMRIELQTANGGQLDEYVSYAEGKVCTWFTCIGKTGIWFDANGEPGRETQYHLPLKKETISIG